MAALRCFRTGRRSVGGTDAIGWRQFRFGESRSYSSTIDSCRIARKLVPVDLQFAPDGRTIGSFSEEVVPSMVRAEAILPTDHYWHEGMSEWSAVGERWMGESPLPLPADIGTHATVQPLEQILASQDCGGSMQKVTRTEKDMALQIFGVLVGLLGIALIFFPPCWTYCRVDPSYRCCLTRPQEFQHVVECPQILNHLL